MLYTAPGHVLEIKFPPLLFLCVIISLASSSFQITETKKVLERALELSERLSDQMDSLQTWFSATEAQLQETEAASERRQKTLLTEKHDEMVRVREKVKNVQR